MIADLPDLDEAQTASGRATARVFWVPAALLALLVGLLIAPASAVPITPSNSRILANWRDAAWRVRG